LDLPHRSSYGVLTPLVEKRTKTPQKPKPTTNLKKRERHLPTSSSAFFVFQVPLDYELVAAWGLKDGQLPPPPQQRGAKKTRKQKPRKGETRYVKSKHFYIKFSKLS
jgi:hypothetical protein